MLTRRDFLKLGGAGLVGLLLAEAGANPALASETPVRQGRVAFPKVSVFDSPSTQGGKIHTFYRDSLLPITKQVLGGTPGDYNRIWYQVGGSGYVNSGGIQLVENILNPIIYDIPESGQIGELTVPYSESWWGIHRPEPAPAYRLYYQTTHWIMGVFRDPRDGSMWYRVYDHLYEAEYYIRPEYVRLIPPEELTPSSPHVPLEEKFIEVQLDEQVLSAFEYDTLVYTARTATGRQGAETPVGIFSTFHKRSTAHMVGGDGVTSMYDLVGVPWDSYITDTGVAFHGTFWHNDFGKPRSFGCINLSPGDARWIYRWTLPAVPPDKNFLYQPGSGTHVMILPTSINFTRSIR